MAVCLQYKDVYGPLVASTTPTWNGGARSIVSYDDYCFFGFEVTRSSVGVVVGLNANDEGTHYVEIEHAIYFTRGTAQIMESGLTVGTDIPYVVGDQFYIVRWGSDVIYCVRPSTAVAADYYQDPRYPGVDLPGVVWDVSTSPSFGTVFLDVSFYSVGDAVFNEVSGERWYVGFGTTPLAATSGVISVSLPFVAKGADVENFGYGQLVFDVDATGTTETGIEGELPFSVLAADIPIESYIIGELPFTVTADGSGGLYPSVSGIVAALEFQAVAGGRANNAGADIALSFDAFATGSGRGPIASGATSIALPFVGFATGTDDVQTPATAGAYVELPFSGFATGTAAGQTAATAGAYVELPFSGFATGSEDAGTVPTIMALEFGFTAAGEILFNSDNRFFITLTFSDSIAVPVPGTGSAEVTDGFAASSTITTAYVVRMQEFLRIVTTPKTFSTQSTELLDTAAAVATAIPGFSLIIQETLGITDDLTIVQAVEMADQLVATGMVQTFYQGVVAVLSALLVGDGSGNGTTGYVGGATVVDGSGTSGDPADIQLTGWFPAGSTVTVNYSTDTGGTDSVSLIVPTDSTAEQVADLLAELLDAQDDLAATATGGGAIEVTPDGGATTVTIVSVIVITPTFTGDPGTAVIGAYSKTVSDELTAASTLQGFIQLLALITEALSITDSMEMTLTIIIEETAEIAAADALELDAQYFQSLVDRVEVLSFIKTPAELAQGWVMNTEENMPVSEYSNYVFNSLAYSPDEMLGCNDQGLYVLDGDDDDGTNIDAEITSLMLDFNTSKLKRMSTAYMGYTSTGTLLLKVRSVDQGIFAEHWYEGRNIAAQTPPGQDRMKLGKGMRSRYWTFELVNIDGSDFELDKVELYPIVLQRRI